MGMLDKVAITRRVCPVIFLLDTSGSMDGAPIGAVDEAMENVIPELASMNESNADNELQFAVLTFDNEARWITGNALVSPENYTWSKLSAYGMTSMGEAFRELNKALSTKGQGFMQRASGSVAPVLFLLSDGEPNDDYQRYLQVLKSNRWYKVAARVAVGYGDSNDDILREFTGNSETVLHTDNPTDLMKMIRFVTITSSQVASSGSAVVTSPDGTTPDPDDNTGKAAKAIHSHGVLNATMDPDDDF